MGILKKRELDEFFLVVPVHHNTDYTKVRRWFDLVNEDPRATSYLAEKLDWELSNMVRYFTRGTYKDYVERIGSVGVKLWRLKEDQIRLAISGYDEERGLEKLEETRDERSSGHLYNPIRPSWFTTKLPAFPYPPIFPVGHDWEDASEAESTNLGYQFWNVKRFGQDLDEVLGELGWGARVDAEVKSIWPTLNKMVAFDPFVTLCYIMSCGRKTMRRKIRKELEQYDFSGRDIGAPLDKVSLFDAGLWLYSWHNIRDRNYTFFHRDFSYLPPLWTKNPDDEYTFHYSKFFVIRWMQEGPFPNIQVVIDRPLEELAQEGL